MSIHRVLVVDDDALSREFMTEAVLSLDFEVQATDSAEAALDELRRDAYDLVLTDLRMPGMGGMDLLTAVEEVCPGIPVVMVTAHGTVESSVEAMRRGAVDFLLKPCSPESIALVLERIGHTHRLEQENAYLRNEVVGKAGAGVIAHSRPMLDTLATAERIASSKGTVLVTGESGTGKEKVAQFIHRTSPRKDGPFVRVNCAALSEQLLESELFGHERGAFTGAHQRREGRFELADGGTLLLDEIGEISPALQTKLLRVLEEEEFERVGGTSTLSIDVRIIATTNRDLAEEVRKGKFREDLYYRLHVLPLHLAPLRERMDDILPLVSHFASHYASERGIETPDLSAAATERMLNWPWPGNVRELENVIQRAVVLLEGDVIRPSHLMFGPSTAASLSTTHSDTHTGSIFDSRGPRPVGSALANRRLADIEREAILSTLEKTGGNKTEAARRLGVTARTLSNKMKLWRSLGLVA